jgi:hypothetical protein
MVLGCGTGVAMWAFSKPLKRAMAGGAKPESPPATAEAAAG